jgi:hypothetical protein
MPEREGRQDANAAERCGDQAGLDPRTVRCSPRSSSPTSPPPEQHGRRLAAVRRREPPSAVYATWKAAGETIDKTKATPTTPVTPADPSKNNWRLGSGADTPPSGLTIEGCGAEVRPDIDDLGLQSGHACRLQFMVHDGDQNKAGGDSGENCVNVVSPG